MELVDIRIPPFHKSFMKWPVECELSECKKRIRMAYEYGRAAKMIYNSYVTLGSKSVDINHIKRRLSGSSIEWYMEAKIGEINPNPSFQIYNPTVIHGYSSSEPIIDNLINGSTIVSVGFVDLGILCGSIFDNSLPMKPVMWIGYEASVYSAAKTSSIIATIQIGASTDAILQVWYSSAWSSDALKYFETAVCFQLEGGKFIAIWCI